jgi:hypothetical protein
MMILLKTVASSFVLLSVLVAAKFLFEDRLSPTESGIHGALIQPRIDILLVGSSHTRQGYDVKLLETATGKHAFSLGYDGLDPVSMLPVVKAMLANPERRPSLLVVEANCVTISRPPDVEDARLFFEAPPGVKTTLIRTYLRAHHGWSDYLDMFALVANRGNDLILTWPLVHGIIDSLSYHGGYLRKTLPGLDSAEFAKLHVPMDSGQLDPDQLAALRAIISLAKSDGVRLWLADTPMPAPIEAQPENITLREAFQRLADAERIPYLRGADGFSASDPALYNDRSHVSTAGRELYTQLFAKEVRSVEKESPRSE